MDAQGSSKALVEVRILDGVLCIFRKFHKNFSPGEDQTFFCLLIIDMNQLVCEDRLVNGDVDYWLGRSPFKAKDKVQFLASLQVVLII